MTSPEFAWEIIKSCPELVLIAVLFAVLWIWVFTAGYDAPD